MSSDTSNKKNIALVETLSTLSYSCGFIILTAFYHTKKRFIIALGIILLAILFAVIRGRRGLILMYGEVLFFSYFLYFFKSKKKLLIIYASIFIGLAGAFYAVHVYRPKQNQIFGFLVQRGDEDTRTGVELYFYDDMKTKDWIVGRGIKGEYFCPDIEEDQPTDFRDTIETGYLQTILNGGLISLGLFLLIAFPAVIKGVFSSKNILSKAAGIWIFMTIINSYPANTNVFSLSYLIAWISIGICYSRRIRYMHESDLENFFQNQKSF